MIPTKEHQLISHLTAFVTENKKELLERVLNKRSRFLTLVLENIFQSQNSSAVLRTCECLGLQDVHIIEDESKYLVNKRVLKGANKWIDLHRYKLKGFSNTEICFRKLREEGYRILVTDPSPDGVSINEVPLDQKTAVVMGNELNGSSDFALAHADQKIFIPMQGFTESFNISVSAAIILHSFLRRIRSSQVNWQLTDGEKENHPLAMVKKNCAQIRFNRTRISEVNSVTLTRF